MNGLKWVASLVLATFVVPAIAATGRITDAKTGEPIEGATVFAVWYYKPITLPLPIEAPAGGDACGDAKIATTDVNGEYDLGLWMNLNIRFRRSAQWTFAPGYFDIQQAHPYNRYWDKEGLLVADTDKKQQSIWTRELVPIDDESTNVRLLALSRSGSSESCTVADFWIEPYSHMTTYNKIIQSSLNSLICEPRVLLDPPRTDVFRALFDPYEGMPTGWRKYVLPYLPMDEKLPVPVDVLQSACSLLFPQEDDSKSRIHQANLRAHRRIVAIDVDTGKPLANLPIRILWKRGWSVRNRREGEIDTSDYSLRSVIAKTDEAGHFDLEINPEMVAEQGLESERAEIEFAVVTYSNDHVSFSWTGGLVQESCGMLLDATMTDGFGGKFGRWLGMRPCVVDTGRRAIKIEKVPKTKVENQSPTLVQPDDKKAYEELTRIATELLQKRRANDEGRNPISNRTDPHFFGEIRAYQWKWPADALIARAYGLLESAEALEMYPEAMIELQRDQIKAAFSKMCEEADETTVGDAYIVSRELWWVEGQTRGLGEANRSARSRAELYENGSRCYQRNGYQPQGGLNRKALSRANACAIWKEVSEELSTPPFEPQASLDALEYDIQCRIGK